MDMNGTVSHKLLKYPKTWLVIGGSFYSNASVSQLFGIQGLFMFVQRDGIWIRIIFILTMYRFVLTTRNVFRSSKHKRPK